MARMPQTSARASLLDRLRSVSADGIGGASGDSGGDGLSVRELKRVVAADLEALLNTRREALVEIGPEFPEARRSLLTYGLPDFSASSLMGPADVRRVCGSIEDAIALFEPRLTRVQVAVDPPRPNDRALRFRVDGWLRSDPIPERVTFDGVLQPSTQQYSIKDDT